MKTTKLDMQLAEEVGDCIDASLTDGDKIYLAAFLGEIRKQPQRSKTNIFEPATERFRAAIAKHALTPDAVDDLTRVINFALVCYSSHIGAAADECDFGIACAVKP